MINRYELVVINTKNGHKGFIKGMKSWNSGVKIDKSKYPNYGMTGKTAWNKGLKMPELSEKMKGNTNGRYNKGKVRTIEMRKKTSEAVLKRYASGEKFGFQNGHEVFDGCEKSWFTSEQMKRDKNHNWVEDRSIAECKYPKEFRRIRKEILKRDNFICQMCGERGNVVHHIDYNKSNISATNLITVCLKHNNVANKRRDYWESFYKNKIQTICESGRMMI